jgi:YjbE family integral membrane protein
VIETAINFIQIIIADLILSGDNALIIGMAAAGLAPEYRQKAIVYGMAIAALLRIVFAIAATKLLGLPGLLFCGSLLLFWVCWRLFEEIREGQQVENQQLAGSVDDLDNESEKNSRRTLGAALISITIADVSMSLDNVLAVAAIADGDTQMLVFGLALAILLMAFAATFIMKLLTRYPWISWMGLLVLLYVASKMLFRGVFDINYGIGPMLGLVEGWDVGKGH